MTKMLSLGDVCEFVGGSQPPKSSFKYAPEEDYVRLIQTSDYKTDQYKTYIPRASTKKFCDSTDIMIGRYGPPIFQILRGLEGAYNVALMKAVPKDVISNDYLYYFLCQKSVYEYVDNLSVRTGGQTGVDLDCLRKYPILVPDLNYQEQAAAVLSALDAKIALNHRINAELEAMAKLLYDYWFVQFDFPISAAQAAVLGKPELEGQPYRSSGGPMTYSADLKREIPAGWKVGDVSELCWLNHRTWPNKNHPDQVTYLDLANAKDGEILGVQEFAWSDAPSRARRVLTPGDSIIGTVRPGNRSFALIPKSDGILTGSTGFAVLTPKSESYREFNYLSLTSEANIKRLTTVASGAAYPAVNPEVVADHSIAIPDVDRVERFHSTVAPSFDLIEQHAKQNQELAALRDWLLPMLMNGQVTVG